MSLFIHFTPPKREANLPSDHNRAVTERPSIRIAKNYRLALCFISTSSEPNRPQSTPVAAAKRQVKIQEFLRKSYYDHITEIYCDTNI
jgi:hypothetical protein